jgi:5-carboxymethyl-2-hydroxymuconate isomerase
VAAEDAHRCVRGVLCANDVTALDLFRPKVDGGLVLAKGLDGFCPLGSDLAPFEILESGVALRTWLNGKLQSEGNSRDMTFSARTVVAFVTKWFTLSPGDLILLGTPGACRIQPGDEVRIEAQGIGSLSNRVVEAS